MRRNEVDIRETTSKVEGRGPVTQSNRLRSRTAAVDSRPASIYGSFTLPLRLTVGEFGQICRICNETVRRMIRRREILAHGKPYLIPRSELLKMGINPADVTEEHFYGDLAA